MGKGGMLSAFAAMFGTDLPKRGKTEFCEWCGEDDYAGEQLTQYDPGHGAELATLCPAHAKELRAMTPPAMRRAIRKVG